MSCNATEMKHNKPYLTEYIFRSDESNPKLSSKKICSSIMAMA